MSILNINTIGIYLILSLIEAIILINLELKNGTFKENYELLNNTLPNLINSNKDNIKKLSDTKIISIGDITSKTIEEYGLKVYKQSETATIASMIDAISNDKFNLNTGVLTC